MLQDHNIRAAGLKVTAQRTHILSLFQRHAGNIAGMLVDAETIHSPTAYGG
jgi:Fe2+ or Zn2+ uptake regulation protein